MEPQPGLSPILLYGCIFALLFCLALIVYLIYRLKKSANEKQFLEAKYHEMEIKFNEIQFDNLDSRLNPHLFKNIINS